MKWLISYYLAFLSSIFTFTFTFTLCLSSIISGREKSVRTIGRRRGSHGGGILDNLTRSVKDGQRNLRNSLAGKGPSWELSLSLS